MSTTTQASDRSKIGVMLMLLAVLMFSLNDVLGKYLVASYSVGQLLLIRSTAAVLFLTPFILKAGWRSLFDVSQPKLMVARVVLTTIEISSFYYAVGYMPLADAMTFWMAAPIYVAALSPFLLGEHVGWRRWTAILIGFAGVIIALRPSSETLTLPALVALTGSVAFSFMMVTGRALRQSSDIAMVFWPTLGVTLLGITALPWATTMPTPIDFVLLALLGVVALMAHFLTNRSLMLADAATVTPYQYTLLVWAMFFGWLVFNETPRITTIIGAVVIVVSGLFIFFREQQLGIKRDTVTEVV
ncbi:MULTISPECIES: DMT family transporter [Mesorhizobium]|uniref:DMT family transporter n=1 Tax=Mesorhizobium denitrificans TaxID=2294114 RepID=A0A371XHE6_9HYPH|nr:MULTISPECIES: DMT family transporter [Mesorhizobium]RFC68613.1 DMT family transporter [Mesorhizobium denitrificans]